MKLIGKIKDLFDAQKYRKKANTLENDLFVLRKDYILSLETIRTMAIQSTEKDKYVEKLKSERKELKRIIEEEMTPKKRKKIK